MWYTDIPHGDHTLRICAVLDGSHNIGCIRGRGRGQAFKPAPPDEQLKGLSGGVSGEDTIHLVLTAMCAVLDHAFGGYSFHYESVKRASEEPPLEQA